jgi:hypothetical protein
VATAVKNAKAGQVQFRVDKAGIVHGTIGRRSFDADKLQGNLAALIEALNKAKPASSKGVYLRKVAVSHHGRGRSRRYPSIAANEKSSAALCPGVVGWGVVAQAIQDRWCRRKPLNHEGQRRWRSRCRWNFPKQLVAATRARVQGLPSNAFEGVDLESESQ